MGVGRYAVNGGGVVVCCVRCEGFGGGRGVEQVWRDYESADIVVCAGGEEAGAVWRPGGC